MLTRMTHRRCVSSLDCSTSGRSERAAPQRPGRLHCHDCCGRRLIGAGRPRARVCAAASYTDAPAAQQQVVALTWEEAVHLQQAQQEQMEDWWGEPAEAAVKPRVAPAVEGAAVRPLKINLDLLLVCAVCHLLRVRAVHLELKGSVPCGDISGGIQGLHRLIRAIDTPACCCAALACVLSWQRLRVVLARDK